MDFEHDRLGWRSQPIDSLDRRRTGQHWMIPVSLAVRIRVRMKLSSAGVNNVVSVEEI